MATLHIRDLKADDFFRMEMIGTILPFDQKAAIECGRIRVLRSHMGKPLRVLDAQIAAIGMVHCATIATRNISDFADCGIMLVNPWEDADT